MWMAHRQIEISMQATMALDTSLTSWVPSFTLKPIIATAIKINRLKQINWTFQYPLTDTIATLLTFSGSNYNAKLIALATMLE